MKNLPARVQAQMDRFRDRATKANKELRQAPMAGANLALRDASIAGLAYGALRTQLPIFDTIVAKAASAAVLAIGGAVAGSPHMVRGAGGIGGNCE